VIGKLFLASISTGIITQNELGWVARNQFNFSRCEQATALILADSLIQASYKLDEILNLMGKPLNQADANRSGQPNQSNLQFFLISGSLIGINCGLMIFVGVYWLDPSVMPT